MTFCFLHSNKKRTKQLIGKKPEVKKKKTQERELELISPREIIKEKYCICGQGGGKTLCATTTSKKGKV
jgi:hypothetical protein